MEQKRKYIWSLNWKVQEQCWGRNPMGVMKAALPLLIFETSDFHHPSTGVMEHLFANSSNRVLSSFLFGPKVLTCSNLVPITVAKQSWLTEAQEARLHWGWDGAD